MKSHDLARLLLTLPDMQVATAALNHEFLSEEGKFHNVKIARLKYRTTKGEREYVIIGDMGRCESVGSNTYIDAVYHGSVDRHFPIRSRDGGYTFCHESLTPKGWVES